jgi:hypothetical protein
MTLAPEPNVINFLRPYFTNVCNKLECLSLACLSSLAFMFVSKVGAYPSKAVSRSLL